jgi:hypothetical protein
LPNPKLTLSLISIRESKDSSAIENITKEYDPLINMALIIFNLKVSILFMMETEEQERY